MNFKNIFLLFFLLIAGCGGGSGTTPSESNIPPIVSAGENQQVVEQSDVSLLGKATDSDGIITSVSWKQLEGTAVALTSKSELNTSFIAPVVKIDSGPQTLVFELTANDDKGSTNKATVTITVTPVNEVPFVDAGEDLEANEQTEVILQGDASDIDGEIISIQWQQESGELVTLADENAIEASFVAPLVLMKNGPQRFSFKLTVTDNEGSENTDIVFVTINPVNEIPVADAGDNFTSLVDEIVTLDCSNSYDPDSQNFTIIWSQTSGTQVELSDVSACNPSLKLTGAPSVREFTLTVKDEHNAESTDTVVVSTRAYSGEEGAAAEPFETFALVGELNVGDAPKSIKVEGSNVFIVGNDGLNIVDTSSLSSPQVSSNVAIDGAVDVLIEDDYAYVSRSSNGLAIIDISAPSLPLFVSWLNTEEANSMVKKGDFLFLADGVGGLKVVDISNKASPVIISQFKPWYLEDARHIAISNNLLYLVSNQTVQDFTGKNHSGSVLSVVDISTPSSPTYVGSIDSVNSAEDIAIKDGYAYLVADEQLMVISVNEPSNPTYISTRRLTSEGTAISISEEKLYVSDRNNSFSVFDIYNLARPSILTTRNKGFIASDITVSGSKLYAIGETGVLNIFDKDVSGNTFLVRKIYAQKEYGGSISIDGDFIYLANGHGTGLKTIDISEPSTAYIASSISTNGGASGVSVMGDYAYLSDTYNGLKIIDKSNPSDLNLIGQTSTDCWARFVKTDEKYAYVLCESAGYNEDSGLKIVDIANSVFPEVVGFFELDKAKSIATENGNAFIANGNHGMKVIDLSNPNEPALVASLQTNVSMNGTANYIALKDQVAYIASGVDGVSVVDINTPDSPIFIDQLKADNAIHLFIDSDLLYVVGDSLTIFDISTPLSPKFKGALTTVDTLNSGATKDGYVYIVGNASVDIYDVETINSEQNFSIVDASASLPYEVNWSRMNAQQAKCQVTGGSCSITIDAQNKSAQVNWSLPEDSGDYQIVIHIGDKGFYSEFKDQITIQ